jgi:DnaA family protein
LTLRPPHQLLLDLQLDWVPSLDNYVAGSNRELVSRLRGLTDPRCYESVYVWGAPSSGKSHLISALASLATTRPVERQDAHTMAAALSPKPGSLLLVDDIDELPAEQQITLFRLFNSARLLGYALMLSGSSPPLQLPLREDLRTRVGQSLIYEIQPLSDEEKQAALQRHARRRGMRLDDNVVHYLLRHGERSMPALMAMLDHLDRSSLEQKRAPTVPLLRELMQSTLELDPK